jgi:hypothetical protein
MYLLFFYIILSNFKFLVLKKKNLQAISKYSWSDLYTNIAMSCFLKILFLDFTKLFIKMAIILFTYLIIRIKFEDYSYTESYDVFDKVWFIDTPCYSNFFDTYNDKYSYAKFKSQTYDIANFQLALTDSLENVNGGLKILKQLHKENYINLLSFQYQNEIPKYKLNLDYYVNKSNRLTFENHKISVNQNPHNILNSMGSFIEIFSNSTRHYKNNAIFSNSNIQNTNHMYKNVEISGMGNYLKKQQIHNNNSIGIDHINPLLDNELSQVSVLSDIIGSGYINVNDTILQNNTKYYDDFDTSCIFPTKLL